MRCASTGPPNLNENNDWTNTRNGQQAQTRRGNCRRNVGIPKTAHRTEELFSGCERVPHIFGARQADKQFKQTRTHAHMLNPEGRNAAVREQRKPNARYHVEMACPNDKHARSCE